jgi:hypothetical protein
MSNFSQGLYIYDNEIDVTITSTSILLDNRPMNNRKLKAHKGVTNEFIFNVTNRDRKPQNLYSDTLRASIINPTNKKRLVTKTLEVNMDLGKAKLLLTDGDLQNIERGLYWIYLTRSDSEIESRPLYSDHNNNVRFEIEVTDQVVQDPVATQTNTTFVQTANTMLGDAANILVSSALYGNIEKNFTDSQHTIAVYPDTYTGQVTVQGSCITGTPDNEDDSKDWFNIQNMDISNSSVINHTTFVVSCNWIRVVSKPTSGSISKVLLRN